MKDGISNHHEKLQREHAEADSWRAFATTTTGLCDVINGLAEIASSAEKIAKDKHIAALKAKFLNAAHSLRSDVDATVEDEEAWGEFMSAWRSAAAETLVWDEEERAELVDTAEKLLLAQIRLLDTNKNEVASGLTDVGGAIFKADRMSQKNLKENPTPSSVIKERKS